MTESTRRTTVQFDPQLHRAIRLKAAHTGQSISGIVNDAVRMVLREDEGDRAAFAQRAGERVLTYEELLRGLKARGKP